MVGTAPVHKPVIPSSAGILLAALKNDVYPLYYSFGRVPSVCIRIRIRSAGFPTNDPRQPAVSEAKAFYGNERSLPPCLNLR